MTDYWEGLYDEEGPEASDFGRSCMNCRNRQNPLNFVQIRRGEFQCCDECFDEIPGDEIIEVIGKLRYSNGHRIIVPKEYVREYP